MYVKQLLNVIVLDPVQLLQQHPSYQSQRNHQRIWPDADLMYTMK